MQWIWYAITEIWAIRNAFIQQNFEKVDKLMDRGMNEQILQTNIETATLK